MPRRILDEKTAKAARIFHKLYLAVYRARKEAPEMFTDQECNRILTAVMGAKWFSWKVIGITPSALKIYAESDFRHRTGKGLARAHKVPRIETVRTLFRKRSPLNAEAFMKFWIKHDTTVICAKGENRASLPPYIPISNDEGELFHCDGKLAGWYHRKAERQFLMTLYQEFRRKKIKLKID